MTAKAEGRDVVVGLVETHGRAETEALVEQRRRSSRAGASRTKAASSRSSTSTPRWRAGRACCCVDELAHTNVPGSRHPKRWQDVEELLDAGIDVWTTLNVQHLESLNDVVLRITGVRVRETVPDAVFEEADEIVLVDLPADELLKRLAEGKVYVAETASRARDNFFKPQNLTALRELALRRAAERVDSDLVERMQGGAIEGPWPAGERLLACVGADGSATSRGAPRQAAGRPDRRAAGWSSPWSGPASGRGRNRPRRLARDLPAGGGARRRDARRWWAGTCRRRSCASPASRTSRRSWSGARAAASWRSSCAGRCRTS